MTHARARNGWDFAPAAGASRPALRSVQRYEAAVTKACRLIDSAEEEPKLDQIARSVGMSRFHFHRVFKIVTGITPKAYALTRRTARVRAALPLRSSVTEGVYGAGFSSAGRFYASASETLGMKPATFRAEGKGEVIRFAVGECSLGSILVAATASGICAITFGDDPNALVHELERRFPRAQLIDYSSLFGVPAATIPVDEHVAGWRAFAHSLDATQHLTGPIVLEEEPEAAVAHTHVRAYHQMKDAPGGELWMVAGHYRVRLVQQGGSWKIAGITLTVFYQEGNQSIPELARARVTEGLSS